MQLAGKRFHRNKEFKIETNAYFECREASRYPIGIVLLEDRYNKYTTLS